MITVNLLPEAYRKPKASSIEPFYRSPLAIFIAIAMIAGVASLWALTRMREGQRTAVEVKLTGLQAQKATADNLKVTVERLRDEQATFQGLMRERSTWSKHLNRLSDATPDGVWFTDLSVDQQKGLVIQGSAMGQGGEEMVRIGRLVNDLKADPTFSAVVKDVQIESIKSVQERDLEIVEFTLTGGLVGAPAKPPGAGSGS
ncbi:MAG: PilN domain-containing protein [Candidatus Omnitrophica bacterium]|nr:PilN domain-containing protein [Candidatus Omnitrophota bacterium]